MQLAQSCGRQFFVWIMTFFVILAIMPSSAASGSKEAISSSSLKQEIEFWEIAQAA